MHLIWNFKLIILVEFSFCCKMIILTINWSYFKISDGWVEHQFRVIWEKKFCCKISRKHHVYVMDRVHKKKVETFLREICLMYLLPAGVRYSPFSWIHHNFRIFTSIKYFKDVFIKNKSLHEKTNWSSMSYNNAVYQTLHENNGNQFLVNENVVWYLMINRPQCNKLSTLHKSIFSSFNVCLIIWDRDFL